MNYYIILTVFVQGISNFFTFVVHTSYVAKRIPQESLSITFAIQFPLKWADLIRIKLQYQKFSLHIHKNMYYSSNIPKNMLKFNVYNTFPGNS
jgi:hypothetical protein